ncbi:MAG: hypothetical protein AAF360_19115 [Pseudomonadota bacterium]
MTATSLKAQGREERLTLTLKADPSGALLTRSIELVRAQSRVRFSFPPDAALHDCLIGEAAEEVVSLVKSALEAPGMFVKPDHVIYLPRLVLSDAVVVIADIQDGGQQVMVRFNRQHGDIMSLFADDTYAKQRLDGGMVGYAVEALEQAYIPLLDFAEHVNQLQSSGILQPGDDVSDALLSISNRIQSMQAYGSIVKRIISTNGDPSVMIDRVSDDELEDEPAGELRALIG